MTSEKLRQLSCDMNEPKNKLIKILNNLESQNKQHAGDLEKLIIKLEILQDKMTK